MSEYQYYEFHALDKPLSVAQQAEMRKLSSRVVLTSSSAAFNYSYSSFRGEPLQVLEEYFDIMLYIANWGSKQLAFRLPVTAFTAEQLEPFLFYDDYEGVRSELHTGEQYHILDLLTYEEGGSGWIEGDGMIAPLIPLREAMLRGDLRMLYLFWLRSAAYLAASYDEDELGPLIEPPVPAGLGQLDGSLSAFMEFFEIDADLVAAAAEQSPDLKVRREPLREWLTLLPEQERMDYLERLAGGESHVGLELLRRLRVLGGANSNTQATQTVRRNFSELQELAKKHQSLRLKAQRDAAEKLRLAKLKDLALREERTWAAIPGLLALKSATGYEQAVAHFADLHELAEYNGQLMRFNQRLEELTLPYASSVALRKRLKQNNLI